MVFKLKEFSLWRKAVSKYGVYSWSNFVLFKYDKLVNTTKN